MIAARRSACASGRLQRPVVVAVRAVWMMQMPVDQIVDMIAMHMVQVAVVQVIDVTVVADSAMTAVGAVRVLVVRVLVVRVFGATRLPVLLWQTSQP